MSRLSVVIPTLGRAALLGRVLDRLEAQDCGPDAFEVVVGADASEPAPDAVRRAADGRRFDCRVFRATTPGVSAARNRAWPEARHPVVLFLGDDMLPAPQLVSRHLAGHRREPDPRIGVLGHVRWARELRITPFMRWLDNGVQFDFGAIRGDRTGWWHFYAANASVKRSMLEDAGGFDEAFRFGYEEMDLAVRLGRLGFGLVYDARAEVEHLHPPTLEAWQERMRVVAVAERRFVDKHPECEPYFLHLFERAMRLPPCSGLGARAANVVPRSLPWIGPRVWHRAERYFSHRLGSAFLETWRSEGG